MLMPSVSEAQDLVSSLSKRRAQIADRLRVCGEALEDLVISADKRSSKSVADLSGEGSRLTVELEVIDRAICKANVALDEARLAAREAADTIARRDVARSWLGLASEGVTIGIALDRGVNSAGLHELDRWRRKVSVAIPH